MKDVANVISKTCQRLFNLEINVLLTRPNHRFGDFSTNVAFQIAKKLNKSPKQIAETIVVNLKDDRIKEAQTAGAGFINIFLNDNILWKLTNKPVDQSLKGREILVEFGDPNPFKAMHLGHLYTAVVGDVIARLFEACGADVKRLSYHGDVGMHVAKCIWTAGESIGWDKNKLSGLEANDLLITQYYAKGAKAYTETKEAAEAIQKVNESVYKRDDELINQIYKVLNGVSFEEFDKIFDKLNIKYDKRYLESQSANIGSEYVRSNVGKVFEESEGAIIFDGEGRGLHKRVFINSRGLPTYEAKDLGLAKIKDKDYPKATKSIIITANEQTEYFKVMLAALGEIDSQLAKKTTHIAHGFLSLSTGKMSSRTGDVFAANDLLNLVYEAAKKQYPDADITKTRTDIAAVKYAFLKQRIGSDIIFDINESVSLEGNSGPYLQYTYARALSIINKSNAQKSDSTDHVQLDQYERALLLKISEYNEVVDRAIMDLMPHHICTYLYELAQVFNSFYEKNRIINNPREALRLEIIKSYANVLGHGLNILSITAPEKM